MNRTNILRTRRGLTLNAAVEAWTIPFRHIREFPFVLQIEF